MFIYTIWDIAFVILLAISIIVILVVILVGCIAFAIKGIAIKAGTKVNEINSDDWGEDE